MKDSSFLLVTLRSFISGVRVHGCRCLDEDIDLDNVSETQIQNDIKSVYETWDEFKEPKNKSSWRIRNVVEVEGGPAKP